MHQEIQSTADGSPTLYVPELDEHYHSVKGALTESVHIFVHTGLDHHPSPTPRVLEIGFGTGLNAFVTLLQAEKEPCREVDYAGIEYYPPSMECLRQMDYPAFVCPERSEDYWLLHEAPWGVPTVITPYFRLNKIQADFTSWSPKGEYDVIYFDAFAPEKQPEMWSPLLIGRLFGCLAPGGIFVTYCAKGAVRRMLQAEGFMVERLPGPPGGKREILRGTKPMQ